ncbi:hypothetical protein [Shewanella donghaensis]|uniref:hypothetical protein n=1 Tax=Shewanella donghaensis TaxID=238836 RepID=UPI001182C8D6|nr:hypothetical protein [Shewanella donghaensis]
MQKNIFVVILTFNILATVSAVANPVTLFVQQCLQYEPSLTALDSSKSPAYQALQFDQLTLGFNNFNDRLNYYRDLVTPSQRENLLMCQLHLADELTKLINQPQLLPTIQTLKKSQAPFSQLGHKLEALKHSQLDINTKSKLHNAQATIRRNLDNSDAKLVFNDPKCNITNNENGTTTDLDMSLAKYLLVQSDEGCRKVTWQAYQARAMKKNKQPLETIKRIKAQSQITNSGIQTTIIDSLLSEQHLSTFLNSQTKNINLAPWNIGQALAQQSSAPYLGPKDSFQLLKDVFELLGELNLQFELIPSERENKLSHSDINSNNISTIKKLPTQRTYRVWHNNRLVGELFIHESNKTSSHIIRQPIIGQQFSQASLTFPEEITNRRQANKIVKSISQSVVGMSRGSQFYIYNKLGISNDNYLLGYYWLTEFIENQIPYLALSDREQLAKAYKKQLRLFRSKLALQFWGGNRYHSDVETALNSHYESINQSFAASFNQQWAEAHTMIYSFNGIANEGIEYYHPLWQQTLVSLINNGANASITNNQVFEIFVVNEKNLDLSQQLAIILSPPNDPQSIIRRALNVGNSQI